MQPSVTEYYEGKSILITGATGFVGKALVEKLLRSCPGVKTIYLLMRKKRGVSSQERIRDLCSNVIFDQLREKQPEAFDKIKLVSGDILEEELGISQDDREELQNNCNIVFHGAACVRFDQKLKFAIHMNTSGTERVLKLAETMKNLEAFLHLSTAYCRCDLPMLDESLYPPAHDPNKIMDLVEWMDDDTLDYLEPRLICSEPNTYSYTKAITEHLVAEYSPKLPIAIGRPSIVTASWKEPMPGWVDNLNGPTGLIAASGKGVLRSMLCNPSYTADAIPVDVVVNGSILIAYLTAIDKPTQMPIYNITLSGVKKLTWREIIELGKHWTLEYPYTVSLWYPGGDIESNRLYHNMKVFLTHLIPAYLLDMLLFLMGRKTFMINVYKRIHHGMTVLEYYTTKEWHFRNKNFLSLKDRINKDERDIFYTDVSPLNANDYLKHYILGIRKYVIKEDESTIPRARKLLKIRFVVHVIAIMLGLSLIGWFFCSIYKRFANAF